MSDLTKVLEGTASLPDVVAKETTNLISLVKAQPALKEGLGFLLAVYEPYFEHKLGSNVLAAALAHQITTGVETGLAAG